MNRRDVIKAFAGGIASVAIGMRVARGMPALTQPSFTPIADEYVGLNYKATERFSAFSFTDWRVCYGSPGVIDVRVDNP